MSRLSTGSPAKRLHTVLTLAFTAPGHGDALGARDMWASVFGIDADKDLFMVLDAFSSVVALPRHVRSAVESVPGLNTELHLRPLPKIEQAFTGQGLHGNRAGYRSSITPDVMVSLEHTAEALRIGGFMERQPPKESLEELRQQVSALIDDVLAADDLEPELREFAVRRLTDLERAFRLIEADGSGAILDVVDSFLGEAFIRDRVAGNGKKGLWLRSELGGRVLAVVGHAANVVGLAQGGPELVAKVMQVLPGG